MKVNLMLDSGAFSAWTSQEDISIEEYGQFILEHLDHFEYIVNLDVIPGEGGRAILPEEQEDAAEQGRKNYWYLINMGVPKEKLIHVFHQGERFYWLEKMIDEMSYIGISPANDRTTEQKIQWLDSCMDYVTDRKGRPTIKFHGFAVTSVRLMLRYPWYSVDSTSWVVYGKFGMILIPHKSQGAYDYRKTYRIFVSARSPKVAMDGKHITTLSCDEKNYILEYIKEQGFKLGKSHIDDFGKEHKIIEGLCNNHILRDNFNMLYYVGLQKTIEPWKTARFNRKDIVERLAVFE
jgi:hypothetical protein